MASCRVKPYQLIDRKLVDDESERKEASQVMLEDGLHDVKGLKKEDQDTDLEDKRKKGNLEMKKNILSGLNK